MDNTDAGPTVFLVMAALILMLVAATLSVLGEIKDTTVKCEQVERVYEGTCEEFRQLATLKYHENKVVELKGEQTND